MGEGGIHFLVTITLVTSKVFVPLIASSSSDGKAAGSFECPGGSISLKRTTRFHPRISHPDIFHLNSTGVTSELPTLMSRLAEARDTIIDLIGGYDFNQSSLLPPADSPFFGYQATLIEALPREWRQKCASHYSAITGYPGHGAPIPPHLGKREFDLALRALNVFPQPIDVREISGGSLYGAASGELIIYRPNFTHTWFAQDRLILAILSNNGAVTLGTRPQNSTDKIRAHCFVKAPLFLHFGRASVITSIHNSYILARRVIRTLTNSFNNIQPSSIRSWVSAPPLPFDLPHSFRAFLLLVEKCARMGMPDTPSQWDIEQWHLLASHAGRVAALFSDGGPGIPIQVDARVFGDVVGHPVPVFPDSVKFLPRNRAQPGVVSGTLSAIVAMPFDDYQVLDSPDSDGTILRGRTVARTIDDGAPDTGFLVSDPRCETTPQGLRSRVVDRARLGKVGDCALAMLEGDNLDIRLHCPRKRAAPNSLHFNPCQATCHLVTAPGDELVAFCNDQERQIPWVAIDIADLSDLLPEFGCSVYVNGKLVLGDGGRNLERELTGALSDLADRADDVATFVHHSPAISAITFGAVVAVGCLAIYKKRGHLAPLLGFLDWIQALRAPSQRDGTVRISRTDRGRGTTRAAEENPVMRPERAIPTSYTPIEPLVAESHPPVGGPQRYQVSRQSRRAL